MSDLRVLYLAPMAFGENPLVDAVAQGLHDGLEAAGIELRVEVADFRASEWPNSANAIFRSATAAGVDAIVVWVTDPGEPADGVAEARSQGIPVISLERPRFPIDGSVVWPNFNHGVYMADHLASLVDRGSDVAIIGGPDVVDDIELLLGLVHGVTSAGLRLVNDPWLPQFRNTTDVRAGGEKAALNVLSEFRTLDGLIPFNDETMLGAIDALKRMDRLGEMKIVSRNGTPLAVNAMRQGVTHGTWDIEPIKIGQMLAGLVIRTVVHREPLNGTCESSPIGRMLTPELLEDWVDWSNRGSRSLLRFGL